VFSKEILSSWKNTISKVGNIQTYHVTFASNLNYTQEMKKFFAFAFVAGMVAFAACTSKPADESADTTAVTVETPAVDTSAVDTSAVADTTAADTTKK
jgi:secreted Zn-dependent insulinase-like peptidase